MNRSRALFAAACCVSLLSVPFAARAQEFGGNIVALGANEILISEASV